MRKFFVVLFALVLVVFSISGVRAATIDLSDWGLNIDGLLTLPGDPMPATVDTSGFNFGTGLGTISITVTGTAGAHSVLGFFNHEIDEQINTFFNESGSTSGAPAAGQSWEIDEPGYSFGDIYGNFAANTLDNFNNVPAGLEDDVSMAMGWNFVHANAADISVINYILSDTLTPSGFHLIHSDSNSHANNFIHSGLDSNGNVDSDANIYFSSNLNTQVIPEPGTLILLGSGLAGLAAFGRKKLFKK